MTTRCSYRACGRPAVGLFTMFPRRARRLLCESCRALIAGTGLSLTPVEGWTARAVRHELPPRVSP